LSDESVAVKRDDLVTPRLHHVIVWVCENELVVFDAPPTPVYFFPFGGVKVSNTPGAIGVKSDNPARPLISLDNPTANNGVFTVCRAQTCYAKWNSRNKENGEQASHGTREYA
jgi:hypothetical protein